MLCLGLLSMAVHGAGCGSMAGEVSDGGPDGDGSSDGASDGGDSKATWTKPAGYASVTFFVDDTANRTYSSGEMRWIGTFFYDPETNIITHDANWGRELAVYPALYDDGPIAEGGHEMPGASAGDHIFSAAVYVEADQDEETLFQYGALNGEGNWIWTGPNGEFSLPPASTERVDAPGFFIHPFGTYDLKLHLDTKALHPDLWPFDPASDQIRIMGSMNSWSVIQLYDDGDQNSSGDEVAGDGLFTYQHSRHLGQHEGLLYGEQNVQFVFLINDIPYRTEDTLPGGVSALVDCDGSFASASILLQPDSLGEFLNPAVSICPGAGQLGMGPVVPEQGPMAGGFQMVLYGSGFSPEAQVRLGSRLVDELWVIDQGQINLLVPPLPPGPATIRVSNPDGSFGELPDAYLALDHQPVEVLHVHPALGRSAGGDLIALSGTGFDPELTISFGGSPASEVTVLSPERATCRNPEHAAGSVSVTVANPDGASHAFSHAFLYSDASDTTLDWAALAGPLSRWMVLGEYPPIVKARVFEPQYTLGLGCSPALMAQLGFGPPGSDPLSEPESWAWDEATCASDCQGCVEMDIFQAAVTGLEPGAHSFAFRFSGDQGQTWLYADGLAGSGDGYQPEHAGRILVQAPDEDFRIHSLEPAGDSIKGGSPVLVRGAGFVEGMTLDLDQEALDVQVVDSQTLSFIAPPGRRGTVDLNLIRPEPDYGVLNIPDAFQYWLVHTPTIDGQLDEDWPEQFLLAHNDQASDWGANQLSQLYLSFDQENLYLALRAWVEPSSGNAVVVYLDRDFGPASGITDMNQLVDRLGADGSGGLDDAISSVCRVEAPGFGAEFALGSVGMASVDVADDDPALLAQAGMRSLADGVDLAALPATVIASSQEHGQGVIEMAIPWNSIFPAGRPNIGTRLALAVRLLNSDGRYMAQSVLPAEDDDQPHTLDQVVVVSCPASF